MLPFLLALVAARAGAAPVSEQRPGRVVVDWTAGRLLVTGAGAPDLRAPGPGVARVAAERQARAEATRRLNEAARALALAGGGTVGERAAVDPEAGRRLATALARPEDVSVSYSSDGTVEVTLAVPLEALRLAVAPMPAPAADEAAPTAVVVDARKLKLKPQLGVTLAAGGVRHAGPTVWHASVEAAGADPRAGARVVRARATGAQGGVVTVDLEPPRLEAAARAGALILVVVP